MIKKLIIAFSVPVLSIITVLLISSSCKKWENPLIAAGTVGAAIAAVWTIIYLEIIKLYFNRPKLEIKEPGFKPQFYRQAPEIGQRLVKTKDNEISSEYYQVGIGYYINIMLKNIGKQTAKNCQPFLTSMWKLIDDKLEPEKNWIPVALQWAGGEDHEYVQDIQRLGILKKIREERNIIPQRPYYFNLGCISTTHTNEFRILQIIGLTGQNDRFGPGEYCFEVTVNGEEVSPCLKYFKVVWKGGCTKEINEVENRFFISMHNDPICKN